jgi:hypothetical protein
VRMSIASTAGTENLSVARTITESAEHIWGIKPHPVPHTAANGFPDPAQPKTGRDRSDRSGGRRSRPGRPRSIGRSRFRECMGRSPGAHRLVHGRHRCPIRTLTPRSRSRWKRCAGTFPLDVDHR